MEQLKTPEHEQGRDMFSTLLGLARGTDPGLTHSSRSGGYRIGEDRRNPSLTRVFTDGGIVSVAAYVGPGGEIRSLNAHMDRASGDFVDVTFDPNGDAMAVDSQHPFSNNEHMVHFQGHDGDEELRERVQEIVSALMPE